MTSTNSHQHSIMFASMNSRDETKRKKLNLSIWALDSDATTTRASRTDPFLCVCVAQQRARACGEGVIEMKRQNLNVPFCAPIENGVRKMINVTERHCDGSECASQPTIAIVKTKQQTI